MGNFMFALEIFCGQGSAIRIGYFQKETDGYHHQQWRAPLRDKKNHQGKSKRTFRRRLESCLTSVSWLSIQEIDKRVMMLLKTKMKERN